MPEVENIPLSECETRPDSDRAVLMHVCSNETGTNWLYQKEDWLNFLPQPSEWDGRDVSRNYLTRSGT